MSKAIIRNSMWQSRSASFATHAARNGVNLLGWDAIVPESLTPEQKREALGAHRGYLEEQLALTRLSKPAGYRETARAIGKAIAKVNSEISLVRPARHDRDLSHFIVDILKPRMTKSEWQRVVAEAQRAKDASEKP